MKKLYLGNAAVARGLYEAGVKVVSSYPGTPSTEITECAAQYGEMFCEWAPNEKVALEVALGASIAGARAFSAMKHVGLNVAADPLFTAAYTGVSGGLVVAVADDPGMNSSQNEQDSRHYAIAAKLPMLEPGDAASCKAHTQLAFELSEKYDTPVLLRLSTRVSHTQGGVEEGERVDPGVSPYEKNAAKYVMVPGNARGRRAVVEKRTADLLEYAESGGINTVERNGAEVGVISSGLCTRYAKEALGKDADYLDLGMVNPLPEKLLRDFAAAHKTVYVIEELDPIIENHCRALGLPVIGRALFPGIGELSQQIVAEKILGIKPEFNALAETLPVRPPVLCPGCPHRGTFYTLNKLRCFVSGDIGCYTLGAMAPLSAIDTTICMGASVSGLHGYLKARPEDAHKAVAVIGDSTFVHSGITGLIDMVYNGCGGTVLILDNSITGMTGHQHNPTTGYTIKDEPAAAVDLEALCRAVGVPRVRVADPGDLKSFEAALREELASGDLSVVIARRPCALLKSVERKPALAVDRDKCKSCRACMRIGCPAIKMVDDKAVIDATLCVGCDLCVQMCAFDAIGEGK